MKPCPACKKIDSVQHSRSKGFWERAVLPLVLLRPFRCSRCRNRFHRFSLRNGVPQRGRRKPQEESAGSAEASLSAQRQDALAFEELIRKIREAEKQGGHSTPEDK